MTQEAFTQEVLGLEKMLYHIAATLLPRPEDRQDAVQSAILKAWRHQNSLRDADRFKPWLARILIRECYHLKRKAGTLVLTDALPEDAAPLRDEALHEAIALLPQKLRVTIVLHYIEGMDCRDIASALQIPGGTVKSRLSAGRAALKSLLNEEVSS